MNTTQDGILARTSMAAAASLSPAGQQPAARRIRLALHAARIVAQTAAAGLGGALMLNLVLPLPPTPFDLMRHCLLAAALLVIAMRSVETRKEGVLAMAAWYTGALASLPFVWMGFFGSAWGWVALPVLVVVLALPAAIAPRRSPALGMALAIALASVPPLGFIGMGSPILLAGALFPGAGWWGLGLTLAALALSASKAKLAVVAQMVVLGWGLAHLQAPAPTAPDLAWAATTYFGEGAPDDLNAMYDVQDEAKRMTTEALNAGAKLIVLPEGTNKLWSAGEAYYWGTVTDLAKEKGATVLLGVYTDTMEPDRVDGVVDLTTGELYPASIAVPFGMWAPWRGRGNFPLHLGATRTIPTSLGQTAYMVCYEELLPWPLAMQMTGNRPALVVSLANQWFGKGWILRSQERGAELQARLWGLPLLRALNHAPLAFD